MNIGIIGTGAYGLSLALMFLENNCNITMWTKFKDEKEWLETRRESEKLPNIKIPNEIKFTNSIKDAIEEKDLILIAVPAGFVDDAAKELKLYMKKGQCICIGSKGIEQDTCLFVSDVVLKYIKTRNIGVISGPSFAIDIANKVPIGLSLATKSKKTERILKKSLQNKYLKLRTTKDILGVEICGSIKNVIAIAAGILDGMGSPESTQAMFITESLHDIKNLIKALGGDSKTVLSFAGFGDLLLTATSKKSRNFSFGRIIGEGKNKDEIDEYIKNTTIEGLYTLKSIHKLVKNKKVKMPIIDLIYSIIYGKDKKPNDLLKFLVNKK